MPIIQRYSNIKKGGVVFTGNTLGLSKKSDVNEPGLLGSIGAFISLNNALQVDGFPLGTTLDYTLNGSSATLNLPANSNILYAELVWGGLYKSSVKNISSVINNNVVFTTPNQTLEIAADVSTAQNFLIPTVGKTVLGFYVRSANVTSLVSAGLNGVYSLEQVPALIEAIDNTTEETNHAGWTLAVVYENQSSPLRNLTLWCGGSVVSPNSGSTDITLSGFLTPETLPITGKLFVSSQEGDAVISGDQMLFGKDVASLTPLSGQNNPINNFFASQINDVDGILDTGGTFGLRNASATSGKNTLACRQGWDITAIDVSNLLANSQNTAAVRFTTTGDLYVPNCFALQVDSDGANIVAVKSVNKTYANINEEIKYTITLTNSGNIDAKNVVVNDLLPNFTVLVPNSIAIDGVPYLGTLPVTIASLSAGKTINITFNVVATEIPATNPIFNIAKVNYDFYPFTGYKVSTDTNSNYARCYIIYKDVSIVKSVDKAFANKNEQLLYTSVITNVSSLPITDVLFTDGVPANTTFVSNSVTIDGNSFPLLDPNLGFSLANMMPGEKKTITFLVTIN